MRASERERALTRHTDSEGHAQREQSQTCTDESQDPSMGAGEVCPPSPSAGARHGRATVQGRRGGQACRL